MSPFGEPEEPSEENFACLLSTTDSQPIEPSKSEVIYSGKSDSLSLNPGTSTMNSETRNGIPESVPRSPEISYSNLSDSSNCSSDLLRFKGSLSVQDALILIDCDTHDFVSSSFVERSNLQTQTTNKNFSVTLADGRICSQPHTVTAPVTLELNDFQSTQLSLCFPWISTMWFLENLGCLFTTRWSTFEQTTFRKDLMKMNRSRKALLNPWHLDPTKHRTLSSTSSLVVRPDMPSEVEIRDLLLGFLKQARLPTMIGHN